MVVGFCLTDLEEEVEDPTLVERELVSGVPGLLESELLLDLAEEEALLVFFRGAPSNVLTDFVLVVFDGSALLGLFCLVSLLVLLGLAATVLIGLTVTDGFFLVAVAVVGAA